MKKNNILKISCAFILAPSLFTIASLPAKAGETDHAYYGFY